MLLGRSELVEQNGVEVRILQQRLIVERGRIYPIPKIAEM